MTVSTRIDVSDPRLYSDDNWYSAFEYLRRTEPVHYTSDSPFGPYWSVTKYNDIVEVELNHRVFSSSYKYGGILIGDLPAGMERRSFIRMDPPEHTQQRGAVAPVMSPANLDKMQAQIRLRTSQVLDALPRGQTFNWVDSVSRELTSRMLATLFDCPLEDRYKLIRWSEIVNTNVNAPNAIVRSEEERHAELLKFQTYVDHLWEERARRPITFDIISILAHGELENKMDPADRIGNLALFLAGGNDTTHNSMSAGVWALGRHPEELAKLQQNPALVATMVPEIVRWMSPVIHMRRTALEDVELRGKTIKKGSKVVMWYVSGNRDEEVFEQPNRFIIDRPRAKQHLAFGFGIHRCIGLRLAELQLRILWEEILKREMKIEVLEPPVFGYSNFLRSIRVLQVKIQ